MCRLLATLSSPVTWRNEIQPPNNGAVRVKCPQTGAMLGRCLAHGRHLTSENVAIIVTFITAFSFEIEINLSSVI